MSPRRLFLFAGYNKYKFVDHMLLRYLHALSQLGDIVFVMDNELSDEETEKLASIPNMLHIQAQTHGEYDFGSYKRAYQFAARNKILGKYDWIYFVNDSVLGPLFKLGPVLEKLESNGTDVVGMFQCVRGDVPRHIQSWFLGMSGAVAGREYVAAFMDKIKKQPSKQLIILKYEIGFSLILQANGATFSAVAEGNRDLYVSPYLQIENGIPFLKKACMNRISCIKLKNMLPDNSILSDIKLWMWENGIERDDEQDVEIPENTAYLLVAEIKLFGCIPFMRVLCKRGYGLLKYKFMFLGIVPILTIRR